MKVGAVKRVSRDPSRVRQVLLERLESDADSDAGLADVDQPKAGRQPVFSSLLSRLTHLRFTEPEARRHLTRIQSHRRALRARLGRDVGLRVALLDYFHNLNRELKNPKVIELEAFERTERSAVTDDLTGLYNHGYFVEALKRETQRSKRHGLRLALVLFDLDDFKRVNDTRGHPEGDKVIAHTARIIHKSLREIDVAARYGGEEFTAILPETAQTGAHIVAERIRNRIEAHFRRRKGPAVTISAGVAAYPENAASSEELLQRADEAVYRSKSAGKNRVTMSSGERRRHLRVPVRHSVTVKGRAARAKNISRGGLLLSLKRPLDVGSMLELVIQQDKNAPSLGLRGEVVRVRPTPGREAQFDVGLKLVNDSSQALAKLQSETRGHTQHRPFRTDPR